MKRLPVILIVICTAAAGFPANLPKKYMPVSEVKRGMKGVGRSVFRGTKIEEFQFEVIDKVKNAFPKEDIIVIRASGQDLELSGIAQGMSGSPCYIDGRMIGAIARTWTGAKIAYAGVTPIEYMLKVGEPGPLRSAEAPHGTIDPAIALATRTIAEAEPRSAPGDGRAASLQPIRTPVFVSTSSDLVLDILAERMARFGMVPVQGGGTGTAEGNVRLEQGSVLTVPMLLGDVTMSASGTVTARVGDTIFAFGHQIKRAGAVRLPMATGSVVTVIPRQGMSFKLTVPLEVVGTITVDRMEGIVGKVGDPPGMIDVTIDVDRTDLGEKATYNIKAIDDWDMTSAVIEAAVGSAIEAMGMMPYDHTIEYRIEIECDDVKEPIVLENMIAGTGGRDTLPVLMRETAFPAALLNRNTIHRVSIKSVRCGVKVSNGRRSAVIQSATLDRNRAAPGESVTIEVLLKPFRGECFTRKVELRIPKDMPTGPTMLEVCDAATAFSHARNGRPHFFNPETFEQLVSSMRYYEHRGKLIARLATNRLGVAIHGVELPSVPNSMMLALRHPRRTQSLSPGASASTSFTQTGWMITGSHRLPILIGPARDSGGSEEQ